MGTLNTLLWKGLKWPTFWIATTFHITIAAFGCPGNMHLNRYGGKSDQYWHEKGYIICRWRLHLKHRCLVWIVLDLTETALNLKLPHDGVPHPLTVRFSPTCQTVSIKDFSYFTIMELQRFSRTETIYRHHKPSLFSMCSSRDSPSSAERSSANAPDTVLSLRHVFLLWYTRYGKGWL